MDIQKSFSKLKKRIPRPRVGSKRKTDRTEAEASGERADSIGSPLPSETHIVAGGGHKSRANTVGWHAHSMDRPPQSDSPEPMPAHPSEGDRGRESDADVGEISKRHWFTVGSRPSREGNHADAERVGRIYPSPSNPPVPHSGKPNSM